MLTELQAAGQEVRGLSAEIDGKVQGLLEREDVKLARVISHMTFIGVLALPGTVFLVVLSSVAVARPMWRLADAIRQLGHEKWQMPIVIDGPADLRALGANLEWMRTRLLASEKQKKAFLRHITHELKTPLAAIMEAGALLRDEVPGPVNDDQRGVLKILKNNADSLVHATEKQLQEHGDKIEAGLKSEIEAALAETKTAIEGGDVEAIKAKAQALTDLAMKMGQQIYEKDQAAAASPGGAGDEQASAGQTGDEDVVDAEFSEVDEDSNKG